MNETFSMLLHDRAHWEFEIFMQLIFDGVIGLLLVPFLCARWKNHIAREKFPVYVGIDWGMSDWARKHEHVDYKTLMSCLHDEKPEKTVDKPLTSD